MPITLDFFESSTVPESLDPVGAIFSRGSPRSVDSQASDIDAIGIYPVHIQWTVVDGAGCYAGVLVTPHLVDAGRSPRIFPFF